MNLVVIEWSGAFALLGALVWLSVIDWRTFRLPNILTKPMIALGLIYHYILSVDLYPCILGAILGYAVFWGVETAYRIIRKRDGLGRGDAKLLALGGAWCGAITLPFIILIASATALFYILSRPKEQRDSLKLPFGPFLSAAIALTFIVLKFLT